MSEPEGGQSQVILLKELRMNLLTDGLIHSELQSWGSSSKCPSDIQGETELSGFRVRVGGSAFSWREERAEALFLC